MGIADFDKVDTVILSILSRRDGLSTSEIASTLKLTPRATRLRLLKLLKKGYIHEVRSSEYDPNKKYYLVKPAYPSLLGQQDNKTKKLIDYNLSVQSTVCKVNKVFRNINKLAFIYQCYQPPNRYFALSNRIEWYNHHLATIRNFSKTFVEEFFNYPENRIYVWPSAPEDILMSSCYQFDIWNGLTLVYRNQESEWETFTFAGTKENNYINISLNELNALKDFSAYIKSAIPATIDMSVTRILPEKKGKLFPNKASPSLYHEPLSNVLFINNKLVRLSKRELHCLQLLSKGFTFKEIARFLEISPRTVETYVDSLKFKTGLYNKSHLIREMAKRSFN